MSLDSQTLTRPTPVAESDAVDDGEPRTSWTEHVVTIIATLTGVLVVAAIAVLMGMA
jgi:hypothetical protein